MTLLDHYLKTVRTYLPKGPEQDDIIRELAELLESQMEDRAQALGRPLTASEQESLLTKHGNPMVVAGRYGSTNRTFSFGRQLIGPELFPIYSRILALNLTLSIVIPLVLSPFDQAPLTPRRFLVPLLVQFTIVTVIFTFIDALQRRSTHPGSWLHADQDWGFRPVYLQRVPKWQSAAGGLVLLLIGVGWAMTRLAPDLFFRRAAESVEFDADWNVIYWSVLILLFVGVLQRAVTFVRPELTLLQAITRLVTNGAMVVLLYPFITNYPHLVVSAAATDVDAATAMAARLNAGLWWTTLAGFSMYWLINAGFHAWVCVQYLRHSQPAHNPLRS